MSFQRTSSKKEDSRKSLNRSDRKIIRCERWSDKLLRNPKLSVTRQRMRTSKRPLNIKSASGSRACSSKRTYRSSAISTAKCRRYTSERPKKCQSALRIARPKPTELRRAASLNSKDLAQTSRTWSVRLNFTRSTSPN